jgi:hypothetical protein
MSHFTTIKTEIYDLDILTQTLRDLNLSFKKGGSIPGPQRLDVDIAVSINCRYCLGFRRNQEKRASEIITSEELARRGEFKETITRILNGYAYRKVLHETRKRGFALIQEERIDPETIKLVLRKVV